LIELLSAVFRSSAVGQTNIGNLSHLSFSIRLDIQSNRP
jgi:hypothetical protein